MEYKFRSFNQTKRQIVSENETLKILEEIFYQGFPKEKRKRLFKNSKNLAKYAFDNYTSYDLTFYKGDRPFVNLKSGDGVFDLLFLDIDNKDDIFVYLAMSYFRVDPKKRFKEDIYEPLPNNKVFLYQIVVFTEDKDKSTRKEMKFINNNEDKSKNKLIVTERIFFKKDGSRKKTIEETTEVDLSNNYFRAPQNFYDYEHLFDYENLLKPEDLHLNKETKEKVGLNKTNSLFLSEKDDSVYKRFKGKNYTKEEWEAYEKEQWDKFNNKN